MSSASSPSETPSCTPPDGASCWLCLEEGPDDSGAPLVRDCSCRGHSGFAHVLCLIQYAESRSRDLVERGLHTRSDIFDEGFFERCPNCKQPFQGGIRHDMIEAQLSFIEREFKGVYDWHLNALITRIDSLDGKVEADRIEAEGIIAKLLTMVEENKGDCLRSLNNMTLAIVYQNIGTFYFRNAASPEKAKYYFEKSRIILAASGDQDAQWMAKLIDTKLSQVEAKLSGDGDSLKKNTVIVIDLSSTRAAYDSFLRLYGETDLKSIQLGVAFARELLLAFHTIEAQRLLNKLVVSSRRVHGSSHEQTKRASAMWKRSKLRYVLIRKALYLEY